MWNFTGRQDDVQGNLDTHGNWLSGINFIDELHLGSQDNLPDEIKNNKGRNTYYFLPLILGIIGLLFHIKFDKKNFYMTFIIFCLYRISHYLFIQIQNHLNLENVTMRLLAHFMFLLFGLV